MQDESPHPGGSVAGATKTASMPPVVDRATFQAELDRLRVREKAHTREGDAIAAARRRLPMVEMDPAIPLTGAHGPRTSEWPGGRPTAQWSRLAAGRSDDLGMKGG